MKIKLNQFKQLKYEKNTFLKLNRFKQLKHEKNTFFRPGHEKMLRMRQLRQNQYSR